MKYPAEGPNACGNEEPGRDPVRYQELGQASNREVLRSVRSLGAVSIDRIPDGFGTFLAGNDVIRDAAGLVFATNDMEDMLALLDPATTEQSTLRLSEVSDAAFRSMMQPGFDRELSEAEANRWRLARQPESIQTVLQVALPRDREKGSDTMLLPFLGDGSAGSPFERYFGGPQTRHKAELPLLLLAFCRAASVRTDVYANMNKVGLRFSLANASLEYWGDCTIQATIQQPVPRVFDTIHANPVKDKSVVMPAFDDAFYKDCLKSNQPPTPQEWARQQLEGRFESPQYWMSRAEKSLRPVQ